MQHKDAGVVEADEEEPASRESSQRNSPAVLTAASVVAARTRPKVAVCLKAPTDPAAVMARLGQWEERASARESSRREADRKRNALNDMLQTQREERDSAQDLLSQDRTSLQPATLRPDLPLKPPLYPAASASRNGAIAASCLVQAPASPLPDSPLAGSQSLVRRSLVASCSGAIKGGVGGGSLRPGFDRVHLEVNSRVTGDYQPFFGRTSISSSVGSVGPAVGLGTSGGPNWTPMTPDEVRVAAKASTSAFMAAAAAFGLSDVDSFPPQTSESFRSSDPFATGSVTAKYSTLLQAIVGSSEGDQKTTPLDSSGRVRPSPNRIMSGRRASSNAVTSLAIADTMDGPEPLALVAPMRFHGPSAFKGKLAMDAKEALAVRRSLAGENPHLRASSSRAQPPAETLDKKAKIAFCGPGVSQKATGNATSGSTLKPSGALYDSSVDSTRGNHTFVVPNFAGLRTADVEPLDPRFNPQTKWKFNASSLRGLGSSYGDFMYIKK